MGSETERASRMGSDGSGKMSAGGEINRVFLKKDFRKEINFFKVCFHSRVDIGFNRPSVNRLKRAVCDGLKYGVLNLSPLRSEEVSGLCHCPE